MRGGVGGGEEGGAVQGMMHAMAWSVLTGR